MLSGAMWKTVLFCVITGLAITHVCEVIYVLSFHKRHHQHHPGTCRAIPGAEHGSEDFAVTTTGDVFITTGLASDSWPPHFLEYYKKSKITGGILLFQFRHPEKGSTRLTFKSSNSFDPTLFIPHGISMIEDKGNEEHLFFVVNHPPALPDRIEKFRFLPKTNELEHLRTYTNERFHNLNDVVAVGPESFYATNFCYSKSSTGVLIEIYTLLSWGSIVFYSQGESEEMVPGLYQPNGVMLSKDGRLLYVNTGDSTTVYDRHHNNSLTLKQTVFLNSLMDNLVPSQDGQILFAGTTPILHKLLKALDDPKENLTPAQVLALPLRDGLIDEKKVTELLYDHGTLISSASVAAVFEGKMLVGSIFDKLVLCDIKIPIP